MKERLTAILSPMLVIGGVLVVAGGVTYAALNSQATLSDTSINTADAGLAIYNSSDSSFDASAPGFTITNLVPGTGTTENVYFQNTGGVPLAITASVPSLPTATGFTGWNNAVVTITAEDSTDCTNAPGYTGNTATAPSPVGSNTTLVTNLQDLAAGNVILPCELSVGAQGNSSVQGTAGNYDFHFDINPSSITGTSASIGNFDFDFTGSQGV